MAREGIRVYPDDKRIINRLASGMNGTQSDVVHLALLIAFGEDIIDVLDDPVEVAMRIKAAQSKPESDTRRVAA